MSLATGFVVVENTKLYCEIKGFGKPLVLIHGGLMDRRMWEEQFEFFSQYFSVIRYDIRGYEKSGQAVGEFSHVHDLYFLLKCLDISKCYILGLSLGGQIAIDFTLEHPEMVEALIPVSSAITGFPYQDTENLGPEFNCIIEEAATGNFVHAADLVSSLPFFVPVEGCNDVILEMKKMIKENLPAWTVSQGNVKWSDPPAAGRLSEIKAPCLVVTGDRDVSDIFRAADALSSNIPEAKKAVIHSAGHHVNMEKPQEFNNTVLEFLNTLNN